MNIVVNNLFFSYHDCQVLDNISFSLNTGELLAVLGPNGVGKTTLFKIILGLQKFKQGEVLLDGINTQKLTARNRAKHIAFIPQITDISLRYFVIDMVLMGRASSISQIGLPSDEDRAIAYKALQQVGIVHLANKLFSCISGGEQQLVLIARAISQNTKTLIMDEPTSFLDYGNQARVMQIIRKLADSGYAIMLSTHNPQSTLLYADTVMALYNKKIEKIGKPKEIVDEKLIRKLYGIETKIIKTHEETVILPMR